MTHTNTNWLHKQLIFKIFFSLFSLAHVMILIDNELIIKKADLLLIGFFLILKNIIQVKQARNAACHSFVFFGDKAPHVQFHILHLTLLLAYDVP
ncbi:hypothetical protein DC498_02765 [Terrimonas sp.]|nr:hypothetical protein DC498_02765 [Terrimonas sp.]